MEPLLAQAEYPRGLKEEDLKDLPLTDPRLRVAYHFLIRNAYASGSVMDERSPEMLAVLRDVKRRGDSATPLWLDIMAKNPNTELECYIPWILRRIGAVQMAPYVDYCRTMVKNRGHEISPTANACALGLFLKFGRDEDVKMVREVAGAQLAPPPVALESVPDDFRKALPVRLPKPLPLPPPRPRKMPLAPRTLEEAAGMEPGPSGDSAASPHPPEWVRTDFGSFTMDLPPGMKRREGRGIDSSVRAYFDDLIDFSSDYGKFSDNLESRGYPVRYKVIRINGSSARVVIYSGSSSCRYLCNVHFPDVGVPDYSLTLGGGAKTKDAFETLIKIYGSVRIKEPEGERKPDHSAGTVRRNTP